uniref:Uncharacterized protein n=1 Tax=Lutzomyia longipalpis TaxID=7200 RepID=A0A1B0CEY5_LUTLO
MVNEIGKLKAYISKIELQQYETDEKISDLIENLDIYELTFPLYVQKLQLERENAALKVENANMTTLAKLVTENMQESLDTSKKMEYTIRQMRAEKDKLLKGSQRDIPDMVYPPPRKSLPQNNVVQIRPEPERPIPVPPKRITEMICKNINSQTYLNNERCISKENHQNFQVNCKLEKELKIGAPLRHSVASRPQDELQRQISRSKEKSMHVSDNMEGSIYSNRKSGIPKPTKFRSSQCTSPVENGNSSFLYGSVNHLPGSLTKSNSSSPSPTEEMSRSRWNLSSRNLQKIVELERQNQKMSEENVKFKAQIASLGSQLSDTKGLFEKEQMTRKTFEAIQNEQKQIIKTLKANVAKRDAEFQQLMEKNGKIRTKLNELLPEENFFEDSDHAILNGTSDNLPEPSIADCMEKMVNEIGKLKAYISKIELQQYETDEKISDLIENKLQLERENAALKVENANMTTLAKLVTENMQESLDTSKKMEYTIRQMRAEKDKLLKGSQRDIPDMVYPPPRKSLPQNNVVQIRPEPERPIPVPPKRITEMHESKVAGEGDGGDDVKECDKADELPEDVIERIRMLEIKLEIAERELTHALSRAEQAETALEELKKKESDSMVHNPPPPPPIPPPLPPPLTMTNTPRVNTVVKIKSLRDGIIERNDSRVARAPASKQNLGQSTGMDALISELKDGRVTLRRRRPTDTGNPALKELFDTLERVQKQNRSSKTLMEINQKELRNVTRTTSERF